MSSTLDQAITDIQHNNYVSVVIIAVIGYDYILTFSEEVKYVWNKRWTWVSTLFVLARYFGMTSVILCAIWGSSFISNPLKTYEFFSTSMLIDVLRKFVVSIDVGNVLFLVASWSFWIFMCSADLKVVMVLRLWVLYNRSIFILGTLLVLYLAEIVPFFISFVIFSKTSDYNPAADTTQVLWYTLCTWEISTAWGRVLDAVQIALSAWMCILIIFRFIKELRQVNKTMKHFRLNQYLKCLAREGVIYFFAMLSYALINVLDKSIPCFTSSARRAIPVGALEQMPPFILIPRFILGLRELYSYGIQGNDVDTAFGLGAVSQHVANESVIMFADDGEDDGEELGSEGQAEEGAQGFSSRE